MPTQLSQIEKNTLLEQRTTKFAIDVANFCKELSYSIPNKHNISQLCRSSGSIGANYREANEALSKKDFLYRIKISKKEAKETLHWITILLSTNPNYQEKGRVLLDEGEQLFKIFCAITHNTIKSKK